MVKKLYGVSKIHLTRYIPLPQSLAIGDWRLAIGGAFCANVAPSAHSAAVATPRTFITPHFKAARQAHASLAAARFCGAIKPPLRRVVSTVLLQCAPVRKATRSYRILSTQGLTAALYISATSTVATPHSSGATIRGHTSVQHALCNSSGRIEAYKKSTFRERLS